MDFPRTGHALGPAIFGRQGRRYCSEICTRSRGLALQVSELHIANISCSSNAKKMTRVGVCSRWRYLHNICKSSKSKDVMPRCPVLSSSRSLGGPQSATKRLLWFARVRKAISARPASTPAANKYEALFLATCILTMPVSASLHMRLRPIINNM